MASRFDFVSRAALSPDGMLHGYAAIFNVPTTKQNQFPGTETIARGAFREVLARDDVLATVEHDPTKLLGRTSSGTLRLSEDDYGLGYEIDLPDTQVGHDVRELVKRGDMRGASFLAAFNRSTMERSDTGVIHRSFNRLLDVTITAAPAYDETSALARTATGHSLRGQLAVIRHRVNHGSK